MLSYPRPRPIQISQRYQEERVYRFSLQKTFTGRNISSHATSVAEHLWYDATVKAASRPETSEPPGSRVKKRTT